MQSTGIGFAAVIAAFSPITFAQTASLPDNGKSNELLDEVVVSGTRIERSGFTAPTPITELGKEDFELRAATTVTSVLFDMPSVRPSVSQGLSQGTGLTPINLRNLGNNRTLVMVDSHRVVPSTIDGVVDGNIVPSALVDKVEVVTGGASAAWGSDAVAGVVNFIFKKKLDGWQGNAQYGQSQHGDTKNTSLSLAWGSGFAGDRGQFMIAGEYSDLSDAQKFGSRDWSRKRWGFVNDTVNGVAVTNAGREGVTLANLASGGVIAGATAGTLPVAALRGIQFGPGSTVQPFNYGTNLSGNFMVGGSGDWYLDQFPWSPDIRRDNVYARTTFDFTDTLHGYVEASMLRATGVIDFIPVYAPNVSVGFISIARDNGYLQTLPGLAPLRSMLNANPAIASFNVGRVMREFGNTSFETKLKTTRYVAGLDGSFGSSYKWKAYFQRGTTHIDSTTNNLLIASNFLASMDTVVNSNGQVACRGVTSTTPATSLIRLADPGCVPGNPFGVGSLSADVRNYVMGTGTNYYSIRQDAGGAQLQAEPLRTWAGPVSVAGGVEYRKESVSGDSDARSKAMTLTGSLGLFQFGNPQPLAGQIKVKEWFAETVVPLAADIRFAKTLDLNAAIRNTDYSTSGTVTTSKLGLTYKPVASILLRGTQSRDIRAPNLNELFQAGAGLAFAAQDYGLLQPNGAPSVYTTNQVAVGNTSLTPEKADTKTFGITWSPEFVQGLQLSVDYYSIDIENAIATVTAQQLVNGCYGVLGFAPTPAFCAAITRDSSGRISNVRTSNINFQSVSTKGLDYEVSYRLPNEIMGGKLTLRALASNLKSYITNTGTSAIDRAGEIVGIGGRLGGTTNPKWRSTLSGIYQIGDLTLFAQSRFISSGKYDIAATPAQLENNHVPSMVYFDISAQYELVRTSSTRLQLYGKVSNLLDKDPPILVSTNPNTVPTNWALYDTVGRAFTAGVRFEF